MDVDKMLNDSTVPIFAGVGGAVVGALALEHVRPMRALAMVVSGAAAGAFVVPALADWAGVAESTRMVSALAFMCGMFTLQAARLLMRQFDRWGEWMIATAAKRAGIDAPPPDGGPTR